MKKIILTAIQYLVFLGLGVWVIYHMLHQLTPVQKDELMNAIKSINAWYLVPVGIVGFLSHLVRAVRWRYLLETVDCRPSVANTFFSVMIGYITNLAVPRAGEVAKCTVLARYEKLPAHKMIGTIVAERAFDMVCLIIITVFTFMLEFRVINTYAQDIIGKLTEKVAEHKSLLFVAGIAFVAFVGFLIFIYRRHKDNKIGKIIREMSHGIFSIIHMKERWKFLVQTVIMWACYIGCAYLGFKCLPATSHLGVPASLVVLVYSSVGVIVTPGGIGLSTLLVAQILAAYGVDEVQAQAFGWVSWVVQTALVIVLGLASLLLINVFNRGKNAEAGLDTAPDIQP